MKMIAGALACLFVAVAMGAESPKAEFLNSGKVYPAGVPLSEAVRVGDTLYLSGQIGVQPGTLKLVPGGLKEEARQTMSNIRTTLEAHGYSMRDVVKCTVMLADIGRWGEFNEIYVTFFSAPYPPAAPRSSSTPRPACSTTGWCPSATPTSKSDRRATKRFSRLNT